MNTRKTFKNLDEQIEILKSRGLVITDLEKTKNILLRENYFFISGYRHLFMKSWKDRNFIPGKTFEELLEICGRSAGFYCGDTLKYEWSFGEEIKIRANFVNFIHVEREKLSVLYIDYWDSDVTNTISEINRAKLEVGLTISELNELFGQEGRFDSAIRKYWWDFDDGKSLGISYYEDKTDPTMPLEKQAKFTGLSEIVITE